MLWTFLFFCTFYVGITRGRFISTDEVLAYQATESLWHKGVPAVSTTENYGTIGRGGYVYSTVSSGQSVAALPLYAVGRLFDRALRGTCWWGVVAGEPLSRDGLVWSGQVEIFFVALFNAFVLAALCACFLAFLLRLGVSPRQALFSTLLTGMTSYIVGYSSTFYTEPVEALALLGAFYALYVDRTASSTRARVAAGLLVALVLVCRYPAIIIVPGLVIYQGYTAWERHRNRPSRSGVARGIVVTLAPLLLGIAVGLLLHALDQFWKFGTIWSQGGYAKAHWNIPLTTGASGLLFSPGESIFLFTPLLLLAPAWFLRFVRSHRAEAVFVLGQAAFYVTVFGKFENWHGLWCYGPRYLMPLVPLLMLPMGEWLEANGRKALLLAAPLALAGLWVQATHVAADFWDVFVSGGYLQLIHSYSYAAGSAIPGNFLFVPSLSPLLAQSRALLSMNWCVDMWLVRVYRQLGTGALLEVLTWWGLFLGACLYAMWRRVRLIESRSHLPPEDAAEPEASEGSPECAPSAPISVAAPALSDDARLSRELWRWGWLASSALTLFLLAFWLVVSPRAPAPQPAPTATADQCATLMQQGVSLLYVAHKPGQAIAIFRAVLVINPRHYGANFQLARALDAVGRHRAASLQWKVVLGMAEACHDETSAAEARHHLAQSARLPRGKPHSALSGKMPRATPSK